MTANIMDPGLASTMTLELRKTIMPLTIFYGFEILVGIIGNLLTMYVFLVRYKHCNFRYFVISLAVTDFIACLTTIPGEVVSQLFWYTYPSHLRPLCKTKAYFNQWTVICEAGFLTLIALDRYRKVCKPHNWQITRDHAFNSCIGIFVFASLFMIQTPIFWGLNTKLKPYSGISTNRTLCERDQNFVDTLWPQANIGVVGSLDILAVVIMLGLYIMVAKRIRLRQLQLRAQIRSTMRPNGNLPGIVARGETSDISTTAGINGSVEDGPSNDDSIQGVREMPEPSERGRRSMFILRAQRKSMMGFCLTVIFVVTTVLYWALIFLVADGILEKITTGVAKVFFFFFLRLYFINHIINPILYGLMDPQFRKEMRQLKNKLLKTCTACSRH